mgnify:FL=1
MNSLFSLSELGNREVEHGAGRDVGKSRVVKFEKIHSAKIENIKNLCGQLPAPGEIVFLWTCNSFNAFTFIPYVIKYSGMIEELCISTYSINTRIVESLTKWYDKGNVRSILLYVSESLRFRMPAVVDLLEAKARDREISIVYAWNHSKVQLIKSNGNYFVVEGSGNFSENAANEQYIFLNNEYVYKFRKGCFDTSA